VPQNQNGQVARNARLVIGEVGCADRPNKTRQEKPRPIPEVPVGDTQKRHTEHRRLRATIAPDRRLGRSAAGCRRPNVRLDVTTGRLAEGAEMCRYAQADWTAGLEF
jgi:hypothetical protein